MTEPAPEADAETAKPVTNPDEMLFRQVPRPWVHDGEPTSQAFRPTKKDEGQLSVSLGSLTTAEGAFVHHITVLKHQSAGSWGLTVAEVSSAQLLAFPQPLSHSPAHGYIDFGGLSNGEAEKKSKVLLAHSRTRGRLHP